MRNGKLKLEMGIMRNGCRVITCLLVFTLVLAAMSSEARAGKLGLSLSGGATLPVGNLGCDFDIGYAGALSISFIPDPVNSNDLGLVARFAMHRFPSESADNFQIVSGELNIKLDRVFAQSPNAYLIGGGGLAKTELAVTETSPFISIGIGVETGHLVLETRLVRVMGDQIKETTFFPVTVGVRF